MTSTFDSEGHRDPAADTPPLPPGYGGAEAPPPAARPMAPTRFPVLAAFLSIVPGLGHLYVGAYQNAAMIWIGIITIFIVIPLPTSIFLALFVWFLGIFDAYRQAQLVNHGAEGAGVPVGSDCHGNLAFGVFLAVVGGVLLLKNFDLVYLEWLRVWWPVIPLLVGLYLIASAVVQRLQRRAPPTDTGDLGDMSGGS